MAKTFLASDSLPRFLEILARSGELYGPSMTEDGVTAFRQIVSAGEVCLDYQRTLIPPKKYLLPPRETVLTCTPDDGYRLPDPTERTTVLFGLHPCDLHGIAYLDQVFMEGTTDPVYAARRNSLVLVGLSCEADEYCFCGDVDADLATGFDIFLHRAPAGFHLQAGSESGREILGEAGHLLVERKAPRGRKKEWTDANIIGKVCETGDTFPESPLWKKFADRCLACGACSACCPTCYCFDVREHGLLDGRKATRLREWDNCLFKTHGEVAGGGSFRSSRLERLHYRYLHKYLGFGPLRGVVSCIGCGRCRAVCPVEIDLAEIIREGVRCSTRP